MPMMTNIDIPNVNRHQRDLLLMFINNQYKQRSHDFANNKGKLNVKRSISPQNYNFYTRKENSNQISQRVDINLFDIEVSPLKKRDCCFPLTLKNQHYIQKGSLELKNSLESSKSKQKLIKICEQYDNIVRAKKKSLSLCQQQNLKRQKAKIKRQLPILMNDFKVCSGLQVSETEFKPLFETKKLDISHKQLKVAKPKKNTILRINDKRIKLNQMDQQTEQNRQYSQLEDQILNVGLEQKQEQTFKRYRQYEIEFSQRRHFNKKLDKLKQIDQKFNEEHQKQSSRSFIEQILTLKFPHKKTKFIKLPLNRLNDRPWIRKIKTSTNEISIIGKARCAESKLDESASSIRDNNLISQQSQR